eukprot:CAMPEP_0198666900 /NCGR_PEP_ID=MMETSP1467-20131203/66540_1 /TAXON_ID=1462469 /ORGANISM="unid. sp., Strain CCMP2135" /LENGTH=57 /DNA_ID=CAMNT_0044403569 /DNA_START=162 /DNA_END=335 /DNA_ORIENTATION=+
MQKGHWRSLRTGRGTSGAVVVVSGVASSTGATTEGALALVRRRRVGAGLSPSRRMEM